MLHTSKNNVDRLLAHKTEATFRPVAADNYNIYVYCINLKRAERVRRVLSCFSFLFFFIIIISAQTLGTKGTEMIVSCYIRVEKVSEVQSGLVNKKRIVSSKRYRVYVRMKERGAKAMEHWRYHNFGTDQFFHAAPRSSSLLRLRASSS